MPDDESASWAIQFTAPEPTLRVLAAAATLGLIDIIGDSPSGEYASIVVDPVFVRTAMLSEVMDLGGVEMLASVIAELCSMMEEAIRGLS